MGIESDQLVYDYLSRVGDLAQRRKTPSAERMRLVARLRAEIDEQRAATADTPAAVKRILGELGTPAEVVIAGGSPWPGAPRGPQPDISRPAEPAPDADPGVPLSRAEPAGPPPSRQPPAADGPSPPHLAGEAELGPRDAAPDWWRVEPGPFGEPGTSVPGFVGGIEIPEMLRPPPGNGAPSPASAAKAEETRRGRAAAAGAERVAPVPPLRTRGATWRGVNRGVWAPLSPVLMTAAALLAAGAFLGSPAVLGLGWVIAYGTRRLSRTEAKLATFGLPGLVAAGAAGWLWGRLDGRWGEPIPQGRMGDVLMDTWPVALRAAAVVSALFLLWRAYRLRRRS